MGMKSTATATATFAAINGGAYYASPDAAPYVLGFTGVLYLIFICIITIFGATGYFFGNFEDEEDREDFVRQLNDPEAKKRREKRGGLF